MGLVGRAVAVTAAAGIGAAAAVATRRSLAPNPPGGVDRWDRTNFRGSTVSLTGGPAAAAGVLAGAGAAGLLPGAAPASPTVRVLSGATIAASAGVGAYDDLFGVTSTKGFKGHLSALAKGEVTSGAVKILVITGSGLMVGTAVSSNPIDAVLSGGVIAGTANMVNLLDLRPGRAIKVTGATSVALLTTDGSTIAGAVLGTVLALAPEDLAEKTMLGDCGANALGAALGIAVVRALGRPGRLATLGILVGLTAASEKISFTQVIESTPGLREIDRLGRVG